MLEQNVQCIVFYWSVVFFRIFHIKFVWMGVVIYDLVYDVQTVIGLC